MPIQGATVSHRCANRLVLEERDDPPALYILRPEGSTAQEWREYHCAELARLRRERNSRGETVPLNRGRVEVERVRVVRG